MLDTTIHKQKHNTICVRHHYTQTNTTQYVLDTTIHKQKHNTICVRHHYTQTNTTQYVLDTTIHKQKHNTICVGHHYTQTKTNYVNKTCVLQTTGGKDEPNIVFFAEIVTDIPTLNSQVSLQTALYCWMCIMLYESSFQIIIHSSMKLRRDMVMLPSVHRPSFVCPSFRNILVNTLGSTSFNGFWPNLVHI